MGAARLIRDRISLEHPDLPQPHEPKIAIPGAAGHGSRAVVGGASTGAGP
jgi:hypothetical protein